jgi:hypothetical protein
MRKLVLIASLLLLSASAQAGSSRSLTLAAHDGTTAQTAPTQQTAEQPKALETSTAAEAKPAEQTSTPAPKTTAKAADARPKHKGVSTEARVIYELHRHGIYW